jgi:hypothetical protein
MVNIYDVLPKDDFDGDGFSNLREFMSDSDGVNVQDIPDCWADGYADGDVDGKDLGNLIVDFGRNDCSIDDPCVSDLDYDDDVDDMDLLFFGEDYGRTDCQ